MKKLSLTSVALCGLMFLTLGLTGCYHEQKPVHMTIVGMHNVEITDFIGPCTPVKGTSNKATCKVEITFDGVAVPKQ